jgi:hypothetical protein
VAHEAAEVAGELGRELALLAQRGVELGRLWAAHGLTAGRLALETSAAALEHSASLLGTLARGFEPPPRP